MHEARIFRVTGEIRKPNLSTSFKKEMIATKPEHAAERVYTDLGSKHRVKRFQIRIIEVAEITAQEIEDPTLKKFVAGDE